MNKILSRFPVVAHEIFKQIDDKSLAKCKEVSRIWCNFLNNDNLLWRRIIQKNVQNQEEFKKYWILVTKKVPIAILKKLALTVEEFFKSNSGEFENQCSPLHVGAERGKVSICKYIIEKTRVINPCRIQDGLTPLQVAACKGDLAVFKYISDHLEDKNPVDNSGYTAFHNAAFQGNLNIVKYLLKHLEDKNPANNDGWTPLHCAAQEGHLKIVKHIAGYLEDKNPADKDGDTPLQIAANEGHLNIVKYIAGSLKEKNTVR